MSSRLMDLGDDEHVLEASEWSWGAAAALLERAAVLGLAQQVELREGGTAEVSARQARAFARHLREEVLPALGPLDWIGLDGERRSEPDEISFQRLLQSKRHHAGREFLERLLAFCERCDGFLLS